VVFAGSALTAGAASSVATGLVAVDIGPFTGSTMHTDRTQPQSLGYPLTTARKMGRAIVVMGLRAQVRVYAPRSESRTDMVNCGSKAAS
jgi:hypothetical protein